MLKCVGCRYVYWRSRARQFRRPTTGEGTAPYKYRHPMLVSPFIRDLTKAELHLHIECTFGPELMLDIARRNGVSLPFATLVAYRTANRMLISQ